MPPKVQRHVRKAGLHAAAVDVMRKQRIELWTKLRNMRSEVKKDDML
jgi:hypothetical protein